MPSTASPKPWRKTFAHSVAHVAGLDTDAIQAMTGAATRGTPTVDSAKRFSILSTVPVPERRPMATRLEIHLEVLHASRTAACWPTRVGARERQRDRRDRAHYGHGHWDYDLPEHVRYPNTIVVNEQGE
jgi:hypothetical protein